MEKEAVKGMTVYAATYASRGESDFGVPRVLGVFTTEDAAVEAVKADIKNYEDIGLHVDYDLMKAENCEWNVEKVEVQ